VVSRGLNLQISTNLRIIFTFILKVLPKIQFMMMTRISYPDGPRVSSPGSPELKTAKELP